MKTYTEKIHAEHVIKLLEDPGPCEQCAATYRHQRKSSSIGQKFRGLWENTEEVCDICTRFVGYDQKTMPDIGIESWCPCHQLGAEEALKKTWIALEEKGYLRMRDNCRCGEKTTMAFSWFTGESICKKCLDKCSHIAKVPV